MNTLYLEYNSSVQRSKSTTGCSHLLFYLATKLDYPIDLIVNHNGENWKPRDLGEDHIGSSLMSHIVFTMQGYYKCKAVHFNRLKQYPENIWLYFHRNYYRYIGPYHSKQVCPPTVGSLLELLEYNDDEDVDS